MEEDLRLFLSSFFPRLLINQTFPRISEDYSTTRSFEFDYFQERGEDK